MAARPGVYADGRLSQPPQGTLQAVERPLDLAEVVTGELDADATSRASEGVARFQASKANAHPIPAARAADGYADLGHLLFRLYGLWFVGFSDTPSSCARE